MDVPLETPLPPRALETSHTVFDSADAPEALFILQTLKLSVVYKSTLLFRRMCCLAETRFFIQALSTIATENPYPPNCRQGHLDLIIDIQLQIDLKYKYTYENAGVCILCR